MTNNEEKVTYAALSLVLGLALGYVVGYVYPISPSPVAYNTDNIEGQPPSINVSDTTTFPPGTDTSIGTMNTSGNGINTGTSINLSAEQSTLQKRMRELWAEHVFWTRQYIESNALNSGDLDVITDRLMKNQEDIGNLLGQNYGGNTGTQLTNLLKEHIQFAVDMVNAAKANNTTGVNDAMTGGQDNAAQIATLLSNANPNWDKNNLQIMLNSHLNLLRTQATQILQKQYPASVATFDQVFMQAMEMADALAVTRNATPTGTTTTPAPGSTTPTAPPTTPPAGTSAPSGGTATPPATPPPTTY